MNVGFTSQWNIAPTTISEESADTPYNTSAARDPASLSLSALESCVPIKSQDMLLETYNLGKDSDTPVPGPGIQTNGSPEVVFIQR